MHATAIAFIADLILVVLDRVALGWCGGLAWVDFFRVVVTWLDVRIWFSLVRFGLV